MYLRLCVYVFFGQCMKLYFYQILYNLNFLNTTFKKILEAVIMQCQYIYNKKQKKVAAKGLINQ